MLVEVCKIPVMCVVCVCVCVCVQAYYCCFLILIGLLGVGFSVSCYIWYASFCFNLLFLILPFLSALNQRQGALKMPFSQSVVFSYCQFPPPPPSIFFFFFLVTTAFVTRFLHTVCVVMSHCNQVAVLWTLTGVRLLPSATAKKWNSYWLNKGSYILILLFMKWHNYYGSWFCLQPSSKRC